MDLHVRFGDSSENLVKTRYWNSEFLGKASAKDLYEKFNLKEEGDPDFIRQSKCQFGIFRYRLQE